MGRLEIRVFVLGMVSTNCYFAINKETKEVLIIDPADQAYKIIRFVEQSGYKPVGILLTHGHFDHVLAVDEVKARFDIPVYCHKDEAELLENDGYDTTMIIGKSLRVKVDHHLRDGQVLNLAGFEIQVLHTPGHTVGGACYYFPEEKTLFSGDTLFYGSVGRTDFPGGSMLALVRSIKTKLFVLPEDTQVYPGHESMTSIGYEKKYNPFIV